MAEDYQKILDDLRTGKLKEYDVEMDHFMEFQHVLMNYQAIKEMADLEVASSSLTISVATSRSAAQSIISMMEAIPIIEKSACYLNYYMLIFIHAERLFLLRLYENVFVEMKRHFTK